MHLTSLFCTSRGGGSSFELRGLRRTFEVAASYLLVTRSMYSNPPRSGAPRKFKCKMSARDSRGTSAVAEWSLACLQGPIALTFPTPV